MAEVAQYKFKFIEIAEMLVKKADIHEGSWSLFVRFGINAANLSINGADHVPTAIVPVLEIGIQKDTEVGPLSVNAEEVNPAPQETTTKKTSGSKKASTKK